MYKLLLLPAAALLLARPTAAQTAPARPDTARLRRIVTGEAVVTATRATDRTGTTFQNLSRQEVRARNFGQDLPYLLDQTPSLVATSDAGAGVGYTDLRIRGVGSSGINTTINGVPLNDPESHGLFLVNLPDLASSVSSLQVQRGVGTSQNGGAAFGASLNLSTLGQRREAYAEALNSFGSFNTWRNTVQFGTGLVSKFFTFDGRLSRIASDGYVRRGNSDLRSYYLAAGFQRENTLVKFITFGGRQRTFQAWNGVPEPALTGDAALLQTWVDNGELSPAAALRAQQEGRRFNFYTYDNQTDNYTQNFYQLHLSQALGDNWNASGALFLTRGFGYFESFREGRRFAAYGLPNPVIGRDTLTRTDLVDQKWLNNHFYGGVGALHYQPAGGRLEATLGGAWNRFANDHYGDIIWAQYAVGLNPRQRYYFNQARKVDYNGYARATWQAAPRLSVYGDLQLRRIGYAVNGIEDEQNDVRTDVAYSFFNPKAGLVFTLAEGQQLYGSFARGQREPIRADFVDRPAGAPLPQPERLDNVEAGYRFQGAGPTLVGQVTALRLSANGYYMGYHNQLVNTGQLNDVGTPLRTNVPRSYRAGVELAAALALAEERLSLSTNLTLSQNRIRDYQAVSYDQNFQPVLAAPRTSTISYSPALVAAATLEAQPLRGLRPALLFKAVGQQYLDNEQNPGRQLPAYQVVDLRLRYAVRPVAAGPEVELALLVNNLLNRLYSANGYTYTYVGASGRPETFNWFFPQAPRNFLLALNVRW